MCARAVILLAVMGGSAVAADAPVSIGPETTRISEPLRADGLPDYVGWLNRRYGEGVTPENNAAVPLFELFGPDSIAEVTHERFFRQIGVPLRFDGPLLPAYPKDKGGPWEAARESPWTAKDHPEVAAWLGENGGLLDLAVEASAHPKYHAPYIAEDEHGPMTSVLLPGLGRIRSVGYALGARAYLALGQGRSEDAWRDIEAIYRWGGHFASRALLIERLVGMALLGTAELMTRKAVLSGRLDAEQVKAWRERRKPFVGVVPSLVETVDFNERFVKLDIFCRLSSQGDIREQMLQKLDALADIRDDMSGLRLGKTIRPLLAQADWNETLRETNRCFDQIVAAWTAPTYDERQAKFEELDRDFKARWVGLSRLDARKNPGQRTTDFLISFLVPDLGRASELETRTRVEIELTNVCLELTLHRLAHGEYLRQWEAEIDEFSGRPLVYRADEKGFVLYSVGYNGTDDNGEGDDVVVRSSPTPVD